MPHHFWVRWARKCMIVAKPERSVMSPVVDLSQDDDVVLERQRHTALVIDRVIFSLALGLVPLGVLVIYFSTREGWSWEPVAELLAFSVIWCLAIFKGVPSPTLRTAAVIGFLMLAAFSVGWYWSISVMIWTRRPYGKSRAFICCTISGYGLGLPLVRQIAEVHGGHARILDEPGCAIEVTFKR